MRLIFPLLSLLSVVSAHAVKRAAIKPTVNPTAINVSPTGGGTYPRLANVSGAILAIYTSFSGATQSITVSRSTDNGKTYTAWGTVATGTSATNDLDNGYLVALANGNLVATFRNHDKTTAGAYTYYRITACVSTDGGKTWAFLSQVAERAISGVNGLWEPFLRVAKSGALQVYYASENASNDQDILMKSSTNGGSTWGAALTVAGGSTTGRDGMPGCADISTGQTICVFETTEGTGTFTVKSVVSTNDGASWGGRSQVYVPTGTNNNAGAPQIVAASNGSGALVVSFMTDEDTSLHQWVTGASMKILTSNPLAAPVWGSKTTVAGVQSNWPGLLALADGSVLGCADTSGAKCHSITLS